MVLGWRDIGSRVTGSTDEWITPGPGSTRIWRFIIRSQRDGHFQPVDRCNVDHVKPFCHKNVIMSNFAHIYVWHVKMFYQSLGKMHTRSLLYSILLINLISLTFLKLYYNNACTFYGEKSLAPFSRDKIVWSINDAAFVSEPVSGHRHNIYFPLV